MRLRRPSPPVEKDETSVLGHRGDVGLVFGYLHVVSVDFSDLQQCLQFFLKIANLTVSGTTFMTLYWKTRNLLGLAIVHGLPDLGVQESWKDPRP